jgi:putative tricarboxylic transport membrane protein
MAKVMLRLINMNRQMVIIISIALVILGVYSLSGRMFDVYVVLICGTIGYFMNIYGYSTAAAALAVVLGRGLERSLRLGLNLTDGDWIALLSRPFTGSFVLVTLVFLSIGIYRTFRLKRKLRAELDNNAGAGAAS